MADTTTVIVDWITFQGTRIKVNSIVAFEPLGFDKLIVYLEGGHRLEFSESTAEMLEYAITSVRKDHE